MVARSLTKTAAPSLILVSVAVFCLLQCPTEAAIITEFGDFETITRAGTSLYSYEDYNGLHTFYPSMNFTCSGNITNLSFITFQSFITLDVRFGTWSVSQDGSQYVRRDFFDVQTAAVTHWMSYRLYEITLKRTMWINFETGDVFGLRLRSSALVPLHQNGGGQDRYTRTTFGNYDDQLFSINSLSVQDDLPLVAVETDNPGCARGFLKRESLMQFAGTNPDEPPFNIRLFDDVASHQLIIPAMRFSTAGVLRKWTFAARFNYRFTGLPELQVWRRNASGRGFVLVDQNRTLLEPRPTGYLNVYEIVLPETHQVNVMEGDVFGVYFPERGDSRYSLAFVANSSGFVLMELDTQSRNLLRFGCTDSQSDSDCFRGFPLVMADIDPESNAGTTSYSAIDVNGAVVIVSGVGGTLLVLGITIITLMIVTLYLMKRRTVARHIEVTENEAYGSIQQRAQANDIEMKQSIVYGVNPEPTPVDDIELKVNVVYGVNQPGTQTGNDEQGETNGAERSAGFQHQDQADVPDHVHGDSTEGRPPPVQSKQDLEEPQNEYDYVHV